MIILIYLIGLVITYYLLMKVCDEYFVASLEKISIRFKLPDDVNGATFMAIGTSAPEFFTAIIALTKVGAQDIGVGTIVGSAMFNLLIIIGAVALIKQITLKWQSLTRDIFFYIFGLIILLLTYWDGVIHWYEAAIFVLAYILYLFVLYYWRTWFPKTEPLPAEMPIVQKAAREQEKKIEKSPNLINQLLSRFDKALRKSFPNLDRYPRLFLVTFIISTFYIIVLSWSLVELSVGLASTLGIPKVIIALTLLAGGTSVPDLLASVFVARKNMGEMAVANAIASNTFAILLAIGFPWLVYIALTQQALVVENSNLLPSIIILLTSVIILFIVFLLTRFRITKVMGYSMIGVYAAFIIFNIILTL